MKKLSLLYVFLLTAVCAFADDTFKEDFESGLPKSATSAETSVTLSSGTWRIVSVLGKKDNNSMRALFNSNGAYLITPALNQPGRVTFNHRSSGAGKKITVEKSTDGGTTWEELGVATTSSASAYGSSSFKCSSAEEDTEVLIRFTSNSSSTYLDNVEITLNSVEGGSPAVIEPDDPTYITEGVWVPTKPFPAAVKTIYIAPDGNDQTGDGSKEKPWFDIQKAVKAATPGTHIVCRGGTYTQRVQSDGKFTVRVTNSGTAENPIVIRCYDGERPVFDFVNGLTNERVGERGFLITGDYWWLFGLHVTHAADNGIKLEGSHNRIERCEFSYNLDTGLQLGFGHKFSDTFPGISQNDGTYCAYNDVIDCDSHHNCDYDANYGSDADGFACKMHNGRGNRFVRCRAWHNSDDAWDLYETDFDVVLAECWAWESGKPEDHLWVKDYIQKSSSMSFSGNGNGIKLGGNGTGGSSKGVHYAFNCISWGHNKSGSVKGFDCNSHKDGHVLVGCLAFDCGYDYMFESGGSDANTKYYNNVCLGKQEIDVGYDDYNALATPMSKNGWTNHLITGVSRADYLSLDEEDALLPRDIYGGLPRKFGRLASDSKMIDAGNASFEDDMPVWQQLVQDFPFLQRTVTGTARDLGPYERTDTSSPTLTTVAGYVIVSNIDELRAALRAVNGSPADASRRFIFLTNGDYDYGTYRNPESGADPYGRDTIKADNVSLIGQSIEGVNIHIQPTMASVSRTSPIVITATGTYLQDFTLQNNYNYGGDDGQAAALMDKGHHTIGKNMRLISKQDTYYSNTDYGQLYFEDSEFQGTVDFICGRGDVFFNRCNLLCVNRKPTQGDYKGDDHIAAPYTIVEDYDAAGGHGYVFNDCFVDCKAQRWDFGRGWRGWPKMAFLNTTLSADAVERHTPRVTEKGIQTSSDSHYMQFHEYNTMDEQGNIVSPESNVLTFTASDSKTYETILTEDEANRFSLSNVYPDWTPDEDCSQVEVTECLMDTPSPTVSDGSPVGTITLTWQTDREAKAFLIERNGGFVTIVDGTVNSLTLTSSSGDLPLGISKSDAWLVQESPSYSVRAANAMGGFGKPCIARAAQTLLKGDTNGDGKVDVADIATVISIMASSVGSGFPAAADVNADGTVDVADIATIISIMAE